tara:strand:- start:4046 stop:4300 length:255 start_codon:yes stop_codon:yes gene_type:complete
MAHFRGTVNSGKKDASRLGHKSTGLTTTCNTWELGIKVDVRFVNGQNIFKVYKTGGSNGASNPELLTTVILDEETGKKATEYHL